ncbi:hypothetical protein HII17_13430 [Thalassotalea sp. M1531]|uniref:Uncharacterized protein n=1 Tax=Thalassotalea algicola TaxID=2716224 RepID=A0A7Y0LE92_9GAMM|nr:hypothetical protein [Thalassotalea algicola]NMP32562.1 hypothetical protein [Thalassotalea algicola]
MYQDKIKQEAKEAISIENVRARHSNIFERSDLLPMSFEPDEDVCDATHIARDILIKRSDKQIIELSKAVTSMLRIGENLLQSLSMKLLDTSSTRKSVVLSEGRSLYLLLDYFDLNELQIKSIQWGELFATLTLMQSAEILHAPSEIDNYEEPLKAYFKQTVQSNIAQLKEEVIDSVARAECLFDKNNNNAKLGSAGGNAKAKHMEPLKVEVIKRYLKNYTEFSARKAGMIIEAELETEKSELLLLSEAEEKNHQFSKWIGDFKNGKWKMPI